MPLNPIPEQPLVESIQTLLDNVASIFEQNLQQQQALINTFLQLEDNNVIRVYVADAIGMGHQSNTVMIMYRLIDLGFNHNFEVIYDDANTTGNTANKLSLLIPGFIPNDGSPEPVAINVNTTATMIALSNFRTNIANYNVRNFGFTGGFDQGAVNLANAPIVGNADSKGVKVAFFLKLQPFQWNQANAIQLKDQVAQISLDNQNVLGMLTFKRKRGYYVQTPIPAPTQADFTGDNAAKFVPYNAIINACTGVNPLVNLLPVYGINSDETGMCKTNGNIRPQNVLFDLIAAIRYTQGSALPNLQRGAIMVVIADVSESCYNNIPPLPNGALSLNILLNGIGNNANAAIPNINQFVTNIQIVEGDLAANHVEIVSYDNPTLNDKILLLQGGAGANKILVVKMPGLPAAAFEYMYACSSLPCLLEGKNTANLVLNLNRPYLNLNSGNYPTLPLTQNGSPETLRCNSTVNSFLDSTTTINNNLGNAFVLNPPSAGFQETPMYKIAQLTEESYTPAVPNQPYVPGNSLQPYFANLQTFFQNQQQDKLFLGLLFFLSYVNNIEVQ